MSTLVKSKRLHPKTNINIDVDISLLTVYGYVRDSLNDIPDEIVIMISAFYYEVNTYLNLLILFKFIT